MRLLVLGGTLFVGRHVVEAALARGDDVTILNRGVTDPGDWPALTRVERLVGDRDGDLGALRGQAGRFDAVIDCSGYTAAQMRRTVTTLQEGAAVQAPPHYVFVSSISAYAAFPPGQDYDESAPLAQGEGRYGADKARAEEALAEGWPGGVAIVRPGLVVGPFDPTGRFTYWPLRFARGGEVLAFGPPERKIHVVDARDLAAFCLRLAAARIDGTFNAVGPWITMADFLQQCAAAVSAPDAPGPSDKRDRPDITIAWRDDATLLAAGVAPWTGLPLWLPAADGEFGGMLRARNDRAVAAGFVARPMSRTIADTLAWARTPDARTPRQVATLGPEAERAVLATPSAS